MWKSDSEGEATGNTSSDNEEARKKIDKKLTPQRIEGPEGVQKNMEEDKDLASLLTEQRKSFQDMAKTLEKVMKDFNKGREELEKKVEEEVKEVTRRITGMEDSWKRKEEQVLRRVEEMLIRAEEKEKDVERRMGKEKKEWIAEVVMEVEKKLEQTKGEKEPRSKQGEKAEASDQNIRREMDVIKRKLERQERKERKNNIVIRGLKYKKAEAKEEIEKFIEDKFKISNGVKTVEAIGRDQESKVTIVQLVDWETKQKIMTGKSRNRLEEVYIDHDLTGEERDVQRRLREIARTQRAQGKEVRVRYRKIGIEGKWYDWNEERAEIVERKFFQK